MVTVHLDFGCSDVPLPFRWRMPRVRRRRPRKPTLAKSHCLLQVWGSNGNRVNVVSERLSLSLGTWQIFFASVQKYPQSFIFAVLLLRQQKFLDYMPFLTLSIKRILHIDKKSSDVYDCAKLIHCKVFETKKIKAKICVLGIQIWFL